VTPQNPYIAGNLCDELIRMVRVEPDPAAWFSNQLFEGSLTRSEKAQIGKVINTIPEMLKGGATTLITAAAKGFGEGVSK
jgi:hypothetical protein